MKKIFFLTLMLLFWQQPSILFSAEYPKPHGHVNDFANIIPADIEAILEMDLKNYRRDTSIEIAVVTVASLSDLSIEEYTIELATRWGVGGRKKDNGIVFLMAPNERKARIEVGYGLEGDLTDAQANSIMQREIIPYFKKGDMTGGIVSGVSAIFRELGLIPYEARVEEKRIAAEKAAADSAEKMEFIKIAFMVFISILLAAGALLWIIRTVKLHIKWRRGMRELHSKNAETLKKIDECIVESEREFVPAKNILALMKTEFPKDVWYRHELKLVALAELSKEMKAYRDDVKKGLANGWKHAEATRRLAGEVLSKASERSSFLELLESERKKQLDAKELSQKILSEYPEKAKNLRPLLDDKDTGPPAKRTFQIARTLYDEGKRIASDKFVDWAKLHLHLKTAEEIFSDSFKQATFDIEFAKRARIEAPQLLKTLPELIRKAANTVTHKDASAATKEMAADAKEKFSKAGLIKDEVLAYRLLLEADRLAKKAISQTDSDIADAEKERIRKKRQEAKNERRRREDSSPIVIGGFSDSGSGSSGGFGGFSGGSFGGGGATGSW